jgi:HEPN superfamily RiboL-PSP-like protein
MSSKARQAFDKNAEDIDRLLEIHQSLGGDARGRRFRLEVLNKSAVVLITAIWEAYCEDLAAEALNHLVDRLKDAAVLPKELKKRIAKELKTDPNEIAIWDLADSGWKEKIRIRLVALAEERNRKLNTPKSDSIDQLFADAIGLPAISDAWRWKRLASEAAKEKLDRYVSLRGAIAHRGKGSAACNKVQVEDYFDQVKHLVGKTGGKVNSFVRDVTGASLW